MSRFLAILLTLGVLWGSAEGGSPSIVGRWQFKSEELEMVAEFLPDGTFRQVNTTARGQENYTGRYEWDGQTLFLHPQGVSQLQPVICRFSDSDSILAIYPTGQSLLWTRLKDARAESKSVPRPGVSLGGLVKGSAGPSLFSGPSRKPTLHMERVWEPNEKAFTFLVPRGWIFRGGVFNVNPLTQNGPGNSISPKCDLAVQRDERGTVMIRIAPSWNYADLTFAPTGFSLFKPGQYYQGMLVKLMPTPKQFLVEMFQTIRPGATQVTVIAEDNMREMVEAIYRANQGVNLQLQQMGLQPNRYDGFAMLVEYTEGGERFREVLRTTLTDARATGFMWSNELTVHFRAPMGEFEIWKPALDVIYNSVEFNPQWLAALTRAIDQRAKTAIETQRYINRVASEIVEHRRRTHAEIRYENYLFITGQEEYVNPFTKKVELDTSAYQYRWMSNHGDILYTDENTYDPNQYEKRPNYEWKKTPIRPR